MSGMWKRSHGRTGEAPPDERGGYGYVRPTATAPHLDSTPSCRCSRRRRVRTVAPHPTLRQHKQATASGGLATFTPLANGEDGTTASVDSCHRPLFAFTAVTGAKPHYPLTHNRA